jgi:site-specific DNA-cytosine methylase
MLETALPLQESSIACNDHQSTKPMYMVDMFAGCGGLSLGFENANFVPVFVNELNADAMSTYLKNRKHSLGGLGFSNKMLTFGAMMRMTFKESALIKWWLTWVICLSFHWNLIRMPH